MIMAMVHAVRPHAGAQHLLDVGVAPGADAGLLVRRDVGRGHLERRLVPEFEAAGKRLVHDVAGRAFRRVAVAAGQDAVDQIVAALDQRRLRVGSANRAAPQAQRQNRYERTDHDGPPPHLRRGLYRRPDTLRLSPGKKKGGPRPPL